MSLKDSKAFSGFSVKDIQEAKKFYTEVLGLQASDNNPMGILELHVNGSSNVLVYPKPNHQPATYTVLNFPVPNIDEAVEALTAKGVKFEQYTGDIQTDEKGIVRANGRGPNIAWFRDPSGNIFSVLEEAQ